MFFGLNRRISTHFWYSITLRSENNGEKRHENKFVRHRKTKSKEKTKKTSNLNETKEKLSSSSRTNESGQKETLLSVSKSRKRTIKKADCFSPISFYWFWSKEKSLIRKKKLRKWENVHFRRDSIVRRAFGRVNKLTVERQVETFDPVWLDDSTSNEIRFERKIDEKNFVRARRISIRSYNKQKKIFVIRNEQNSFDRRRKRVFMKRNKIDGRESLSIVFENDQTIETRRIDVVNGDSTFSIGRNRSRIDRTVWIRRSKIELLD